MQYAMGPKSWTATTLYCTTVYFAFFADSEPEVVFEWAHDACSSHAVCSCASHGEAILPLTNALFPAFVQENVNADSMSKCPAGMPWPTRGNLRRGTSAFMTPPYSRVL